MKYLKNAAKADMVFGRYENKCEVNIVYSSIHSCSSSSLPSTGSGSGMLLASFKYSVKSLTTEWLV
jgi:hypothetical protein